jgi:hypothetical protein
MRFATAITSLSVLGLAFAQDNSTSSPNMVCVYH